MNNQLSYRPLIGGIGIVGSLVGETGTIGLILTRDDTDRWILSSYHVLVGPLKTAIYAGGEAVYQPASPPAVAKLVIGMADNAPDMDCAAALVEPGIDAQCCILGIGMIHGVLGVTDLKVGLRVIKSGAATGITEGIVTDVTGNLVAIEPPPGCDEGYDLSARGDSGAVWVTREPFGDKRFAVAMHSRSEEGVKAIAYAITMAAIVKKLGLGFPKP